MNKKSIAFILGVLACLNFSYKAQADFGTLFTTVSERKAIDDNRYVKKRVKWQASVAKIEVHKIEEVIYKTIKKEYKISGVTIASNGVDSAWINGELRENGVLIDGKIQLKIDPNKQKVRLTVRGGKTYYGQSGDIVTVSYRVPLLD